MSENSIRDCIKQESFTTKELRLDLERNPCCPECQVAAISYHETLIRYLEVLDLIIRKKISVGAIFLSRNVEEYNDTVYYQERKITDSEWQSVRSFYE